MDLDHSGCDMHVRRETIFASETHARLSISAYATVLLTFFLIFQKLFHGAAEFQRVIAEIAHRTPLRIVIRKIMTNLLGLEFHLERITFVY